jgi:purine-nucleoside phosphorylase
LLLVAADWREFKPLCGLEGHFAPCEIGLRWAAWGALNGQLALLAAHGPGRQNARQAVQVACAQFAVTALISTGVAGALDPALRVGDTFLPSLVIEFRTQVEYAVRLPAFCPEGARRGRLLTVDTVIQDADSKADLHDSGAEAVDMEASAVAAEAEARGLPFYCVRAISDDAETSFPLDFNRARRRDGTFSGWELMAQAALEPSSLKELWALRRDAEVAFQALGDFLQACKFES